MKLAISPRLKAALPSTTEEQDKELEATIVEAGGAIDSIKVWNGMIVDGHRRYSICMKLGLPYPTEVLDFPDEDAAEAWMLTQQSARRNLSAEQIARKRARKAELLSKGVGAQAAVEAVAAEEGLNRRSVHRDNAYLKSLDKLRAAGIDHPAIEGAGKTLVTSLAKLSPRKQKECIAQVDAGEASLSQAVKKAASKKKKKIVEKPTGHYFDESARALGLLKKSLDDLENAYPRGVHHDSAIHFADQVGKVLVAWRKEK